MAQARIDTGTGADGALHVTVNGTLPTGTYNYSSILIDAGVDLIVAKPVTIKCTGAIVVNGGLHCGGAFTIKASTITVGAAGIISGALTIQAYGVTNNGLITGDAIAACGGAATLIHQIVAISAAYDQTITFKTASDIVSVTTSGFTAVNADSASAAFYIGASLIASGSGNSSWADSVVTTGWANATTARTYLAVGNRIAGSAIAEIGINHVGTIGAVASMGTPSITVYEPITSSQTVII